MNKKWHILFRISISFLIALYFFLIAIILYSHFRTNTEKPVGDTFILDKNDSLIEALVSEMSIEEKIGQLFILNVRKAESEDKEKIDSIVQKLHLGGILLSQTSLFDKLVITNYLKSREIKPLFIASKANVINENNCHLPIGKIINALNDTNFSYKYIDNYVNILKTQNVNFELSNCLNPVDIDQCEYAFHDNEKIAIHQSLYFNNRLINNKIAGCVDFNDSLFFCADTLAVDSLCQLKNSEISLSEFLAMKMPEKVVNSILKKGCLYNFANFYKKYYGFRGLVVAQLSADSEADDLKLLFEAGAELFISDEYTETYIEKLKNLVETDVLKEAELNSRVKRILNAKKWTLPKQKQVKSAEIDYAKILNTKNIQLSWNLHKKSISLIKNSGNILPFKNFLDTKTHLFMLGRNKFAEFREILRNYTNFTTQIAGKKSKIVKKTLKKSDNIIILIDKNYEIDNSLIKYLKKINKKKRIIIVSFGGDINKLLFADAILFAYNEHNFSQMNAAQVIAGSLKPSGILIPNIANNKIVKCSYSAINRFKYTIPEDAGFSSFKLQKLDSLILNTIEKRATPGAQILAAKNGKVFLYKSYGYQSYKKNRRVQNADIYDVASITKVAATTMSAMKLYEKGKINLNDSIKDYIEDTVNCSIKNHKLIDFFLHKTGMPPDMPILKYIMYTDTATGRFDKYFAEKPDSVHSIKLTDKYYLRRDYLDSIKQSLYNLEIDTTKQYVYSDINLNVIYDILNRKISGSYVNYLNRFIYNPLQLQTIGFLPLERFEKTQIAPTQKDRYWRKQLLHGTVHDEAAALYGGVAGNAGLFSNANDIAIIFQMLINGGTYGNAKIFEPKTVEYFTTPPENERRALGFQMKKGSFGHTGFTGCVVWANPKTKFIFVFLSNSIHPRMMNKKLRKMKIRSKAYNIILQSAL